jgi:hypothetical protein
MILLKMPGALSLPAEHDEDFSVRYKNGALHVERLIKMSPLEKTLLPSVPSMAGTIFIMSARCDRHGLPIKFIIQLM